MNRKSNFNSFMCLFAVMAFSFYASGCVPLIIGAAVGAGGYAFVKGVLEYNFDANVSSVHKAAVASLKAHKVLIMEDELNKHSAKITGDFEDGQGVKIEIEALTERSSKIKIRVGVIGDEKRSESILGLIKKRFK